MKLQPTDYAKLLIVTLGIIITGVVTLPLLGAMLGSKAAAELVALGIIVLVAANLRNPQG